MFLRDSCGRLLGFFFMEVMGLGFEGFFIRVRLLGLSFRFSRGCFYGCRVLSFV